MMQLQWVFKYHYIYYRYKKLAGSFTHPLKNKASMLRKYYCLTTLNVVVFCPSYNLR